MSEDVFRRTLVVIDGSESGLEACRQVAQLSQAEAPVDAVGVVHFATATDTGEADEALDEAMALLDDRAVRRRIDGFVTSALLAELRTFDATLVAFGSSDHRRAGDILLGGSAGELLHKAPCSVLVARPSDPATFPQTIVVGHDGSPDADVALTAARELAQRLDSSLQVVTSLAGRLVDHARLGEVGVTTVAEPPVVALVEAARDADLLVVGSRGLHGVEALGSVSERVAYDAPCSVLVVRG